MERIDFENTIRKMKKEPNADYRLLSAFESYFIFNYEGFEHPRILFQSKLDSDDDTLELKETTPEELLLRKRIEEARKKETFSDMLLRLIRESGKTAPEVYRAAGIDPRHFSKINSNKDYRPTKETVLAFAIALHLSFDNTEELLKKAGFAFSSYNMLDTAIQFFIEHHIFDRKLIDDIMEKVGIPLLPQNW